MVNQPIERITIETFFALSEESDERLELIEGEVVMSPSPTPRHQDIVLNVAAMMRQQAGKVYVAPIEVVLDETVVQPDVIYLRPNSQCKVDEKRLVGPPDLVVEVLSPGTERRDRKEKFELYEAQGLGEYWMIDPDAGLIEVWAREDQRFTRVGVFVAGETFASGMLALDAVVVAVILGE